MCEPVKNIFLPLSLLFALTFILKPIQCSSQSIDQQEIIFQEVIEGEIESENFTYYVVDSDEDILLNLTSIFGDCDLYITQSKNSGENPSKPTIDLNSYDLQSTTCGDDVIFIDRFILRPFCIGIYAHPSYSTCSYKLKIYGTEPVRNESDEQMNNEAPRHTKRRAEQTIEDDEFTEDVDTFSEFALNFLIKFLSFVFEIFML